MKPMVTLFSFLFLAYSPLLAAQLKGTVRDAETGELLPGANIYIEGVERGAYYRPRRTICHRQCRRRQPHARRKFYRIQRTPQPRCRRKPDAVELFVELIPEVFRGKEIIIVADRAKMRETPVAFSDVPKADMQRKLGSRDLPLILNDTPGVYAPSKAEAMAILASMCAALTSATSPL